MSDFVTVDATPSEHKGLYWDKYHTNNLDEIIANIYTQEMKDKLDEIIAKYKEEQRNPPRDADGYVIRDGFLETIITMRERR